MEQTQAYFISKRIAETKTAEEMAEVLNTEFGFNSSYLTLENKQAKMQEIGENIQEEQERLRYNPNATQFWGKREYSLEDLYLVRASDVFNVGHKMTVPKDGQVLSHMDFKFKAFEAAKRAVGLGNNYTSEEYMAKKEELKKVEDSITPYLRQYRSTKHFTVNTLVSDNSGGSWANMPYIFIDAMKPHLDNKNLSSIAPHDTFFRDDVQLVNPTMLIQQQHLAELLKQNNPAIVETLLQTELIILDNNCKEFGSPSDYVAYVLTQLKEAPYYHCHDHGVNISSREGVFQPLANFAKQNNIPYGSDHFYSTEKKMDELHFMRNIAEDSFNYLAFISTNPRLGLTEEQTAIIDAALKEYQETCIQAAENGVPLDFTEENTPCAEYEHLRDQGYKADYNRAYSVFAQLSSIVEDAFENSRVYETVDISILAEETQKYNQEYQEALAKSAEYSRVEMFKSDATLTPTEE